MEVFVVVVVVVFILFYFVSFFFSFRINNGKIRSNCENLNII